MTTMTRVGFQLLLRNNHWILEQIDFAEIISCSQHLSTVACTYCIYIWVVDSLKHSLTCEPQLARPSTPFSVLHGCGTHHLCLVISHIHIVKQQFIILSVYHYIVTVFTPIQMQQGTMDSGFDYHFLFQHLFTYLTHFYIEIAIMSSKCTHSVVRTDLKILNPWVGFPFGIGFEYALIRKNNLEGLNIQ